ncbi:TIGR03936 family radical SAM-associated protein [Neosynechococcus sphagnicola]|uniref:TIGR03936 family radical SAM-associated protein n=1 Tax=Neosynechococcus sphagnicola TaxID=1501145 RepID=UPI0030845482
MRGGQTATSNPEPYADFFDFIALGDGEELLPEIGLVLELGQASGLSREALLLDLAQVPGVYVPQFYTMAADGSVHPHRADVPQRVLRRVATPIPAYSVGLVPYVETVHDRLVIEVRRGCTRGCRFCQPGMLTRPARDVEPEQVIAAVEQGLEATGYDELSLLSLSCSDYLALPAVGIELRNRLREEKISLSLPSQRVDRFDENIAQMLGGNRQAGLTFAPEAGTQRLRDIVNKGLSNEELLRGVKTAYEQGWDRIKLYFMIGLPGETDTDVVGIAETVRWLQQECSQRGRKPLSFNLTISNFTPKPHTPFQWHSVSTTEFKRKQNLLRQEFRYLRGLKVNFTDVRISAMEDFVGRGDRRLGTVVQRAWELGAGMDSWWESTDRAFAAWTQAIAESGLTWKYRLVEQGEWNLFPSPGAEMTSGPPPLDAPLPWDHLDTGIDKQWLQADLERALAAAIVPDCSFDGCSHCGVCGSDFGHNIVIAPPPIPAFLGSSAIEPQRVQRLRVWFGKQGDMALVGHLDLLRLFDRALRRAKLPIGFSNGFHPTPRLAFASALPLGATSSGELVDFELTTAMPPEIFQTQLAAQLPAEIPLYHTAVVDLKAPAATQLLTQAEYEITVRVQPPTDGETSPAEWQPWVNAILTVTEVWIDHITKSGKPQAINLRDRLFTLEVVEGMAETAVLQYVGSCRNDGTLFRPEHLITMLERVSQREFQLHQVHRRQLLLAETVALGTEGAPTSGTEPV